MNNDTSTRIFRPLALCAASVALLAACGGGGSGSSSGTSSGGSSTSTPTNAVAQMEFLGPAPDDLIATQTGIYGLMNGTPNKVVKWQRTPGAVGWLSYTLPTTVSNFSPIQLINDTGLDIYYAGFRSSDVKQVYSYLGSAELDDVGINRIVASGGTTARQWALTISGEAWLRATGGGSARNARSTFTRIAQTGQGYLGDIAAATDTDNTLYAGSGSTLVRVTTSGAVTTWNMQSTVNSIVSALGTVWVGAGGTIYRFKGNTLEGFAQVQSVFSATAPIFCISNLNLYTSNGMVYQGISATTAAPAPKPFLSTSGSVEATSSRFKDFSAATSGMMASGVRCASNVDEFVFTSAIDMNNTSAGLQLMKIRPL